MSETPIVRVEQGPRWLVEFFMNPPWWFEPTMTAIGLVAACLVAYRLYERGWRITNDQQWRMLGIAGTVVAVMTGVLAMTNYTHAPYIVDVSVGFAIGYGSVLALDRLTLPLPLPPGRARLTTSWGILAASAFILPLIAALNGKGTLLGAPRLYLVALGAVMIVYNEVLADELLGPD